MIKLVKSLNIIYEDKEISNEFDKDIFNMFNLVQKSIMTKENKIKLL